MKKFLKNALIIPFAAVALLVTSCGGGKSYWEGEATTDAEKIAKEACDCMASILTDAGVNIDVMLGTDEAAKMKEMEKMANAKMGEGSCIEGIEKKAEEAKIDKSEMRKAGEGKCKLMKM